MDDQVDGEFGQLSSVFMPGLYVKSCTAPRKLEYWVSDCFLKEKR